MGMFHRKVPRLRATDRHCRHKVTQSCFERGGRSAYRPHTNRNVAPGDGAQNG